MTDVRTALRWGTWAFGGLTLLLFYRSAALDAAVGFEHPAVARWAYLVSLAAWGSTLVVLLLPEHPPSWAGLRRWITVALIAVTLAAAAAATVAVPAGVQHTSASWAVATTGWLLLALSIGNRTAVVLTWLAAPPAVAMAVAVAGGPTETVMMTARVVGVLGLQVPVALAARALERSADATTALWLQQEAIRTDRVVADTLHDDRLRRSRAVVTLVEPVLAGLAGPGNRGDDLGDALRRHCDVAAAQVRRLLMEWHRGGPDPLGDDVGACLDRAQASGVRVDVAVPGSLGPAGLPAPLRRVVCDVLGGLTSERISRARLSIVSTTTQLRLAIVAHAVPGTDARHLSMIVPATVPAPLTLRTTTADDSFWVELTCPA